MEHYSYTPVSSKPNNRYLQLPESQFTMIDHGRQDEIDDFYTVNDE